MERLAPIVTIITFQYTHWHLRLASLRITPYLRRKNRRQSRNSEKHSRQKQVWLLLNGFCLMHPFTKLVCIRHAFDKHSARIAIALSLREDGASLTGAPPLSSFGRGE
jgi:uncharacterized membrane protein YccF (DUF307 family)